MNLFDFKISKYSSVKDNAGISISIPRVIQVICREENKLINQIRGETDKKARAKLKQQLEAVTWSGLFEKRNAESLKEYSGLICLDVDNILNISLVKKRLTRDPYILFLFTSPSGSGLKLIIRVDGGPEKHLHNFIALRNYFYNHYQIEIDESGKDICRLCFISYDPDAVFNRNSSLFDIADDYQDEPAPIPMPVPAASKKAATPQKPDSRPDIDLLIEAVETNRIDITSMYQDWLNIGFGLADEYGEGGREYFHNLSRFHSQYDRAKTDKQYNECLKARKSGITIKTLYQIAKDHGIIIRPAKAKEKRPATPATLKAPISQLPDQDTLESITREEFAEKYQFFDIKFERPKDEEDSTKRVRDLQINYVKFLHILETLGFRRMDIDKSRCLIHINNNIIREVDSTNIQDAFLKHIRKLPDKIELGDIKITKTMILNKVLKSLSFYFSKELLYQLKGCDNVNMNADTKDEAFFYYQNKYVRVTQAAIEVLDYASLKDQVIWDNSILPRNIQILEEEPNEENIWFKFLSNVCAGDETKLHSLCTIIGYLMHKYYEGKMKGIIFTDSRISDNPEGRTGKGLICKGIGYMLNKKMGLDNVYCEINGKSFDTNDNRRYQMAEINTKLIHLDDVKPNYNVEAHYTELANGILVDKKNIHPFIIYVKMVITTNRTIKLRGASSLDRFEMFDLSDHYSDSYSPEQDFKKWFFRDFTEKEWYLFDTLMLICSQMYLRDGLVRTKSINLEKRVLHEQVGEELVNFLQDFPNGEIDMAFAGDFGIIPNRQYNKKDLYNLFIKKTEIDSRKLSQRVFTSKLRLYKEYMMRWKKDVQDKEGDFAQERRSSGNDLIWFVEQ